MSNEIKYNSNSKDNLKRKLSIVEDTLRENVNALSDLYDTINLFGENPEVIEILSKLSDVKDMKVTTMNNIEELKLKSDMNLNQISELDEKTSEKFKGW